MIDTGKIVGASLLAKAVCQAPVMVNEVASSRAGSVPQWIYVDADSVFGSDQNCRSEPAREGGGSVTGDGECTGLFAGKPAPTVDLE